jgi:hypothetical protein
LCHLRNNVCGNHYRACRNQLFDKAQADLAEPLDRKPHAPDGVTTEDIFNKGSCTIHQAMCGHWGWVAAATFIDRGTHDMAGRESDLRHVTRLSTYILCRYIGACEFVHKVPERAKAGGAQNWVCFLPVRHYHGFAAT